MKGAGQEISLQCELCGKENGTTTITTTANSSGSDKIDSIQKTAAFEAMKTGSVVFSLSLLVNRSNRDSEYSLSFAIFALMPLLLFPFFCWKMKGETI